MRKFKLVKCYPGSPELETIHSDENKTEEWRGCNYYIEYPEYWEEITNIYYLVFTKEETSFNTWEPIRVDAYPLDSDSRKYFSTQREAITFIFYNKPCLSYSDVKKNIHVGYTTERILNGIIKTVKSKI